MKFRISYVFDAKDKSEATRLAVQRGITSHALWQLKITTVRGHKPKVRCGVAKNGLLLTSPDTFESLAAGRRFAKAYREVDLKSSKDAGRPSSTFSVVRV